MLFRSITIEVSVAGTKIKSAKLVSSEDSDFTKPAIETTGLAVILKKCFLQSYKAIFSLVFFIAQKGLPLSRCEAWSASHLHPFGDPIASQRVTELLHSITEDDRQRFLTL